MGVFMSVAIDNYYRRKQNAKVIKCLKELERIWPQGLMLFSHNGTLELTEGHPCNGGKCIATFRIPNDAGDL